MEEPGVAVVLLENEVLLSKKRKGVGPRKEEAERRKEVDEVKDKLEMKSIKGMQGATEGRYIQRQPIGSKEALAKKGHPMVITEGPIVACAADKIIIYIFL